jgi:YggT family protein
VGGTDAGVFVLSTAGDKVVRFVDVFIYVYILLIFAYILSTWVRAGYSPTFARVQRFLHETCDPYLRLFRRVIPPLGPIDVSPMVAVVVLIVIDRLIGRVL